MYYKKNTKSFDRSGKYRNDNIVGRYRPKRIKEYDTDKIHLCFSLIENSIKKQKEQGKTKEEIIENIYKQLLSIKSFEDRYKEFFEYYLQYLINEKGILNQTLKGTIEYVYNVTEKEEKKKQSLEDDYLK